MDFNDVLYHINEASPYIYTGMGILGGWIGTLSSEVFLKNPIQAKKLLKEVESIEPENINGDTKNHALVINGVPNKKDIKIDTNSERKYGKAIGILLRKKGYNVKGIDVNGYRNEHLSEFLKEHGSKAEKLIIYFKGHGDHEGAANLPPPDETVKLLSEFDNADTELVLDCCGAGSYVEEAGRKNPKNLKVYASSKKRGTSTGAFTKRILQKAKKKKWEFDSMGDIIPSRPVSPFFRSLLLPFEAYDYVKGLLKGEKPYTRTAKVQTYSPSANI